MQETFRLLIMLPDILPFWQLTWTVWCFFFLLEQIFFFWYGLINCLDFCCLAESANCIWRCKGEWQRCTQIDNNQKHCFRKKKRGSSLEVVWRSWYLLYSGCKTSLTKHGLGSTWGVLMLSLWSISCVIARRQQHFWMIARHSEHPPPRPKRLRDCQPRPARATAMFGQTESCGHRSSKWPLQGLGCHMSQIPDKIFQSCNLGTVYNSCIFLGLSIAGGPVSPWHAQDIWWCFLHSLPPCKACTSNLPQGPKGLDTWTCFDLNFSTLSGH